MAARIRKVTVATVRLWGRDVGAVAWDEPRGLGNFEYDPAFARQGRNVAPLMMPVRLASFRFRRSTGIRFTACRGCWPTRCRTGTGTG
jgi:hypothetical protein